MDGHRGKRMVQALAARSGRLITWHILYSGHQRNMDRMAFLGPATRTDNERTTLRALIVMAYRHFWRV